jgi:hypothetical protein
MAEIAWAALPASVTLAALTAEASPRLLADETGLAVTCLLGAPALLEANRRLAAQDIGLNRFLGDFKPSA